MMHSIYPKVFARYLSRRLICIVESKEFLDNYNSAMMKNIVPSGMFAEIYHYDFVTMSAIEKCSAAIHAVRNQERKKNDPNSNIKSWVAYCNNEYNRHSVYARTLALKYKVDLIEQNYGADYSLVSKDRIWKIYEHMRWNMYTRTMGYQVASKEMMDALGKLDKDTRNIAMIHKDLILFEELPKEEQDKDGIVLTPEIVAELEQSVASAYKCPVCQKRMYKMVFPEGKDPVLYLGLDKMKSFSPARVFMCPCGRIYATRKGCKLVDGPVYSATLVGDKTNSMGITLFNMWWEYFNSIGSLTARRRE